MFEKKLNILQVCPKGFNKSTIVLDEDSNAFIYCKIKESYISVAEKESYDNDQSFNDKYNYHKEESDNSEYYYYDYSFCEEENDNINISNNNDNNNNDNDDIDIENTDKNEKEFYGYIPIEDIPIRQLEILTLRILENDIDLKGIDKYYFLSRKMYKEAEKGDTTTHRMIRFKIENYLLKINKTKTEESNVEIEKYETKSHTKESKQKSQNSICKEINKNPKEIEIDSDNENENGCCFIC